MMQWFDQERPLDGIYRGYTDFFLYPSDLFIALAVVLGLLVPFVRGQRWQRGPWYLTFPLIGLVGLSFLSALTGIDPALTVYHAVRMLLLLGVYFALVNTPMPPLWVATALSLAVMIQSVVAILQFQLQSSLGLGAWGELTLNPSDTGASILRYDDVRILRAYGLTDHPNLLGGFLAFALIYIMGYYLGSAHSPSPENERAPAGNRARYFFLVPLALGAIGLFYTFSRSAELAFGVGVVVLVVAQLRGRRQPVPPLRDLALIAVILFAALLVPALSNQRLLALRLGQDNAFTENVSEARSLEERDVLLESANRVFYSHQLLGVGVGALAVGMYYLDTDFPKDQYFYQPAHLVVLDVAAELGLGGGFLWLWLMLAPLVGMWIKRAAILSNPWNAGVAAVVIVLLVAGLFDYYPWFWQSGRIWQWSAWGLFAAAFAGRPDA
jgi:hypothetical protein